MSKSTLRKTLLAASIAASSQVYAASGVTDLTQDVSGSTEVGFNLTDHANVTLTGDAKRALGEDGVGFEGAKIRGDLINNADISAEGQYVDGLDLDVADLEGTIVTTDVAGDVINNGLIELTGEGSVGIVLDGANAKNLVNNGTIDVLDDSDSTGADKVRGIELGNSTLKGGVLNTGTIIATGDGAKGITAFSNGLGLTTIGGDIENQGNLSISGDNSIGIELDNVKFGNNLLNNGGLSATGSSATSLLVDDTSYNSIVNTGGIVARSVGDDGTHANAIVVMDSTGPQSYDGTNGIINTGNIIADGTAIKIGSRELSDVGTDTTFITQNDGLIRGGDNAIVGNQRTILHFNGGTIDGVISGLQAMDVNGAAEYTGNSIGSKEVRVKGGQLNLSELHTDISGNLSIDSGAALQVRMSDSTDVATPVVSVGGTASFASGSKLNVTANPDDFTGTRQGTSYTLVSANDIQNSGLAVESTSALLKIKSFQIGQKLVTAVVTSKDGEEAQDTLKDQASSRNAQNAIAPFVDSVLGQMSADDKVFKAFTTASEAELAKLSEQLAPQVNGGATQAAMGTQSLVSSAINTRLGSSSGLSSGDVLQETGVWVKALHSDADQSRRNSIEGFDASTNGIIVGADGKLNEQTTLGIAYSYASTDVDSDDNNSTDVKSQALTAYGSWEQGPIFVDASLTYGKSDNESKRHIAGTTAKADYDSDLFGINVLGGYGFNVGDGYIVEPRAALRYSNLKIDGYTEHGSSAALSVDGQRIEVGELGAGVRFTKDFAVGTGTLKPELTLMAYHDLIADQADTTSAFVLGGNAFVSNAAEPTRDSYEASLGTEYSVGAVTFGASYNYLRKADFNADTFALKARYDF
ncbi:autotransporter domain-containing protein (plasmid) [Pseudomonas nitroreducens]|uniref:autotransporter family protein n=1 Tax=Pseudomonas TaxID=286 RepID=UPI000311BB89|nr:MULTISPECIES: autotransporter outer membrane beta-barrel domain-containing protein [Pseudomonas]MDU4255835.1 autotransporter domain-containing protein [Pseudomonas sp.]HBO6301742.1 autotransporter domain-containing protein [Pseudomonas aeruginosa]